MFLNFGTVFGTLILKAKEPSKVRDFNVMYLQNVSNANLTSRCPTMENDKIVEIKKSKVRLATETVICIGPTDFEA